jgi:transcriptional regulator with XRE-family HTH domain
MSRLTDVKDSALAAARVAKGFTQQKVADSIGVPLRTYQDWEYGRIKLTNVGAGKVLALSKLLKIKIEELINEY